MLNYSRLTVLTLRRSKMGSFYCLCLSKAGKPYSLNLNNLYGVNNMLSIKEISFIRALAASKVKGDQIKAEIINGIEPVFKQAEAYVSLVEKIKRLKLRDNKPTILYGKGSNDSHQDIGYNVCLLELKSFIDES